MVSLDLIACLKAVAMGIMEGLTEFIPISSSGHLVILSKFMHIPDDDFSKTFEVAIQLGAILAVVWNFRADLKDRCINLIKNKDPQERKLFLGIIIAFIPAALVGFLFHKKIEGLLGSTYAVAIAQIVGAFIILGAEKINKTFTQKTTSLDDVTWKQALGVGVAQIASLWPGMSRSGMTIMGGLLCKLDRQTATKFSFYLSIPIMTAATFFVVIKHRSVLTTSDHLIELFLGFVTSFIVGLAVVRFLLDYIKKHSFAPFAYYRIILGITIIVLTYFNVL